QSGLQIEEGMPVLTKEDIDFINVIFAQLVADDQSVASATLPPIANELHIRLSGQKYFVKFNMEGDARYQVGAFLAVKQKLQADGRKPADYIDVRVEEKVYYR